MPTWQAEVVVATPLARDARAALAVPLAACLRTLHAVSADEAQRHGAGFDMLARLDVGSRRAATSERLRALWHTIALLERASATGDDDMTRETRTALDELIAT